MSDANEQLLALLGLPSTATSAFAASSRYHGVALAARSLPDRRTLVFVRRRFVPPSDRFTTLQEHVVVGGERLDLIAAKYLGDPEQFWRICDANGAIRPSELEVVGRRLRITLPEGLA
jgi:hypothetical protein